jgi:hypothetical protein
LQYEQLSFIAPIEKIHTKTKTTWIEMQCHKCLCDKCKNSVEIYPSLSTDECKEVKSCFNCDECYYYGMDNEKLSRGKVKIKCDRFKKSNYYVEREAEMRRKKFKVIE